jgi:hypothetical protein
VAEGGALGVGEGGVPCYVPGGLLVGDVEAGWRRGGIRIAGCDGVGLGMMEYTKHKLVVREGIGGRKLGKCWGIRMLEV